MVPVFRLRARGPNWNILVPLFDENDVGTSIQAFFSTFDFENKRSKFRSKFRGRTVKVYTGIVITPRRPNKADSRLGGRLWPRLAVPRRGSKLEDFDTFFRRKMHGKIVSEGYFHFGLRKLGVTFSGPDPKIAQVIVVRKNVMKLA